MARPRRFERPTPAFGGQYSIQLSYGRLGAAILPFACCHVQSIDLLAASIEEGSRGFETLGVVAVIQAVDPYPPVARWRMDKPGIAQVDADMRKWPVAGVEEDEVTGPQ
jgi:hypothetical protein